MKLLFTLLAAASCVTVGNAAVAFCDGPCELELALSCADVIDQYEFSGSCCSLQEVNDNCKIVTTSDCSFKIKGDDGCTIGDDGSIACVAPETSYTSNSEDPCPASQFDVFSAGEEDCTYYCCIDSTCCGPTTTWNGSQCMPNGIGGGPTLPEVCSDFVCAGAECCAPGTGLADDPSRGTLPDGSPSCMCIEMATTDPPTDPVAAPTPKPTVLSF